MECEFKKIKESVMQMETWVHQIQGVHMSFLTLMIKLYDIKP